MDHGELADIIGRAQNGDPDAFDILVDTYGRRLHAYLYRLTGSVADADDLLQELFLRVVRTISSYKHDSRFEGWLFRIGTNLARDRLRRAVRKGYEHSIDSKPSEDDRRDWVAIADLKQPAPETPLILKEEVDAMQRALAEISPAEREVIMLRHFSDLSFAEIAEAMGTPLGTALARAHRGLTKLRELMSND